MSPEQIFTQTRKILFNTIPYSVIGRFKPWEQFGNDFPMDGAKHPKIVIGHKKGQEK